VDFPELSQLELEKLRKENMELKAKLEKAEAVLRDNDLLEAIPSTSDAELICTSQLAKYQKATAQGAVLSLEEVKIVEIMLRSLQLARGKQVPEEKKGKKKKDEPTDLGKLLQLAGQKLDE